MSTGVRHSPMKLRVPTNPLALDSASDIQLVLLHPDPIGVDVLRNAFKYILHFGSHCRIVQGTFQTVSDYDCITCPSNSIGIMDEGFGCDVCTYFGWGVMQRTQQKIIDEFCGEQPVGSCILVETGNARHPWLAHTAVMYGANDNLEQTYNVYNTLWSTLLAIRSHNKTHKPDKAIRKVLMPVQAIVGMELDKVAQQLSFAFSNFINRDQIYRYAQMAQAKRDPLTVEEEGYLLTCDFANRRHFIFSKDHLLEIEEDEKRTFPSVI